MDRVSVNTIRGISTKVNNILLALDDDEKNFDNVEEMISELQNSCFNLVQTLRSRNFDKKDHPWR